jgi:4-hydroxybenzoyl-CoA thioesterase/acyl-CoA thioester hydrolase
MAYEYRTTRRIQFAETDAAGIIHFASYFRYMEEAEHEFLRSLGLSVMMIRSGECITWPRVSASCEFLRPVRFEDVVDVHVSVVRKGEKSLTYQIVFSKDGAVVARGQLVAACCRKDARGLTAIPIPDYIGARIEQRPEVVASSAEV